MAFCLVGHYDGVGSGGRCVRCPSCRRGASDDAASVAFDHSTEVNMDAGTGSMRIILQTLERGEDAIGHPWFILGQRRPEMECTSVRSGSKEHDVWGCGWNRVVVERATKTASRMD